MRTKKTILDIKQKKRNHENIVSVTVYDYIMTKIADDLGMDLLLVGDSLGMTFAGHETTLPVSMDMMVYHSQIVMRAAKTALVVADLPFLSYHVSPEQAIQHAGRLLKEGGVQAVKLEGGKPMVETIQRIVRAGIPVMGHIGLLPQSVHAIGGYKVYGKTQVEQDQLCEDACALEAAGCFAIVLECVPLSVAKMITERLTIPTIGIGAGPHCDGQILVMHDLLGATDGHVPKFVKQDADVKHVCQEALGRYANEVRDGTFPEKKHGFS